MASDRDQAARARPYVQALLDLAADPARAETIQGDLDALADLLRSNADLAALARSEVLPAQAKSAAVGRIFAGQLDELTLQFLRVLADHDRLRLLEVLGEQFRRARDERAGRVKIEATTAVALDEAGRGRLLARLAGMLGAPVLLEERVDPDLIGGLVLRIGDSLFDGSVRGRLEQMRRQVIARGRHEIQGGRDFLAD